MRHTLPRLTSYFFVPIVALVAAVVFPCVSHAEDGVDDAKAVLANVEARISQLEREVQNPVAQSRYYPIERRLVDGEVYYELENYPKAAVLFLDASQNAAFPTHPERLDVLYKLGFSLLQIKNFLGAREALEQAVAAGPSLVYDKSLRYLIEIGLMTRSGTGLDAAVAKTLLLTVRGSETEYALGKGLLRLGRDREAITSMARVPATAAEFGPSQYYMGVALVDQEQWTEALAAFQRSLVVCATDPTRAAVAELARMAIARLDTQLGKFADAIEQYQEIPRGSEHFHRALYEMTWAYVDSEQLDKALNALDLLLLTVEDDKLATDAHILRGRLSVELDRTDAAQEAYSEVLDRFRPLREEIDSFSKDKQALKKYFKWLLERHETAFLSKELLSERAAAWIESDPQLKVLVGLFDDMSVQRTELADAKNILDEIDTALAAESRLESFPNLRSAWTRAVLAKNELVDVSHAAIVAKEAAARETLGAGGEKTLDALATTRERAEERFLAAPRSTADYEKRVEAARTDMSDLSREAFFIDQVLKTVGGELRAVEHWVTDTPYRTVPGSPEETFSREELPRIKADVEAGRKRYAVLTKRLTSLRERLERAETAVGAGDTFDRTQDALRADVLAAHQRIDQFADSALRGDGAVAGASEIRRRTLSALARLDRVTRAIDAAAKGKAGEFHGELKAERTLLDGYARQIAAFERDSDHMAKDVGAPLFHDAKDRLDSVVLEADMGSVDIAWKRKQRESDRISELQKEREDSLKQIESTLDGLQKAQ